MRSSAELRLPGSELVAWRRHERVEWRPREIVIAYVEQVWNLSAAEWMPSSMIVARGL